MKRNLTLIIFAIVLLAILAAAVVWLLAQRSGGVTAGAIKPLQATNLALDIRYAYNPLVFTLAEYDPTADYPLRLEAEDFVLVGKRIRGLADMLGKDPEALLYDFVGVTHIREYEEGYRLELAADPHHEDVRLGGLLGLEQRLAYRLGESGRWPQYFPAYAKPDDPATAIHLTGWAVFSSHDLFFYQTVSTQPLTEQQRLACLEILNSIEYGAVLSGQQSEAGE